MKAVSHPQQAARLSALRSYEILDTPRESDFDDIVQLASEICQTPISVVNLIDADRQWFKAETGLGVRETPLDTSICSHVILQDQFTEIPDTLADTRMRDNPLCLSDNGLRFYAGALLKTAEGLPIGTLCVLDYKPRKLTPFQRRSLEVLANQVMKQFDLRRALRRQELLLKEIDHRVKNSLQSVIALIRLQRRSAPDADIRNFLSAVEGRVARISLLHAYLYKMGDIPELDLGAYLRGLREVLEDTVPTNVTIGIDADPIIGDSAQAAGLGVIASEFVINSGKHAFPDGRTGMIGIELRAGDSQIELLCRDDGIGRSGTSTGVDGIGLRLIEAAAEQLGGEARILAPPKGFAIAVQIPATA
jgi:two-component sensor histidine kinase